MNLNARQLSASGGRWTVMVLLACTLGASFFLFRPGIAMSDTLTRWAAVFTVVGKVNVGWSMEQWLAPVMTIFMLPIGLFGLPTEFFTLFQLGYLLLAASVWAAMTSSQRPFWIALPFFLPLVFIYISFIVPDIWVLAAIILIVGSIFAFENGWRWAPLVLFFLSCVVLFGFRTNALVLLPLVFVIIFSAKMISRRLKGLLVGLVILANLLIFAIPSWLGFGERTSTAAAPAWELVGMLRIARETKTSVDSALSLDGIADTNLAIKAHSFATIDTLLWGAEAALPSGIILGNSDELKKRWLHLLVKYPSLYFQMKMKTYKCMLGLCDDYLQLQIGLVETYPELNGLISIYGKSEGVSASIFQFGNWSGKALRSMLIPIFWLPISLVVILLNWREYGRYDRWLLVMSGAYLASFFILNQAASFRYMFPVYVVFTAYQFRFIGRFLGGVPRKSILLRAGKNI